MTNLPRLSRRDVLFASGILAGGSYARSASAGTVDPIAADHQISAVAYSEEHWDAPGEPGKDYDPVITPNGWTLPYTVVERVKVYHLIAEEVPDHEFAPGLVAHCWGFNGSVHGPTIEAVEGDRIRVYVTNRIPEKTSIHWHGLLLPNGMDGVAGLNQPAIEPGETFKYEFTLRNPGTHLYHSHHDEMTQMALGMMGLLIVHPRQRTQRPVQRDFAYMLSEWRIDAGTHRPNPMAMSDFNVLTLNGRAFPGTDPMVVRQGERVRIRLGNLSAMDHHSMHLHGYQFMVTETDGGPITDAQQQPHVTVLVPVGSTRTIEFVATEPGDWAFHCHMTHHVMNQMGHTVPSTIGVDAKVLDAMVQPLLPDYMTMGRDGMGDMGEMGMPVPPNTIPMVGGAGPSGYITMGGMFTILKVHPDITSYESVGWYRHPQGTQARKAAREELRRDGINPNGAGPRRGSNNQKTPSRPQTKQSEKGE